MVQGACQSQPGGGGVAMATKVNQQIKDALVFCPHYITFMPICLTPESRRFGQQKRSGCWCGRETSIMSSRRRSWAASASNVPSSFSSPFSHFHFHTFTSVFFFLSSFISCLCTSKEDHLVHCALEDEEAPHPSWRLLQLI